MWQRKRDKKSRGEKAKGTKGGRQGRPHLQLQELLGAQAQAQALQLLGVTRPINPVGHQRRASASLGVEHRRFEL